MKLLHYFLPAPVRQADAKPIGARHWALSARATWAALIGAVVALVPGARATNPNAIVQYYPSTLFFPSNSLPFAATGIVNVTAPLTLSAFPATVNVQVAAAQMPLGDAATALSYVHLSTSTLTFTQAGQTLPIVVTVNAPETALSPQIPGGSYSYTLTTSGWPAGVIANSSQVQFSASVGHVPLVIQGTAPFVGSVVKTYTSPYSYGDGISRTASYYAVPVSVPPGADVATAAGYIALSPTTNTYTDAGQAVDVTATATVPTTAAPGAYYYRLVSVGWPADSFLFNSDSDIEVWVTSNTTGTGSPVVAIPQPDVLPLGGNAVLTANVTSSDSVLGYQWYRNGTPITGATGTTLEIGPATADDLGVYSFAATNAAGVGLDAVALLVTPAPASITAQPVAQAAIEGQSVTFTAAANGTGPLTYQWLLNNKAIAGATAPTLTLSNVQLTDAGKYSFVVTNSAGSIESNVAQLTVTAPPLITAQPQSQSAILGSFAFFSVQVSGTTPLTYQWRLNGAPISGATAASLNIASVSAADAGVYDVVVTNSAGTVTSAPATLTVVFPPTITSGPQSANVTPGSSVTFNVSATGTAPLAYQWYVNGAPISGATDTSLTLTNVQASDSGNYYVVVSNSAGQMTGAATLVVAVPPTITTQPQSQTVSAGQSVSFTVGASGTSLTYQWVLNGSPIAGATDVTFTLASAQLTDAGAYSVVVSNAAGSVTSDAAQLQVFGVPTLSTLTPNTVQSPGSDFTLTVSGSGFAPAAQVLWNGSPRTTTYVDGNTLQAAISAADVTTTTDLTAVSVSVVNPNNNESAPLSFTITSTNVSAVDSASTAPGGTTTVSTTSTATAPVTVSATLQNSTSSSETLSVATYNTTPATVPAIEVGDQYVDVQAIGATSNDSVTSSFYYASSYTGTAETDLQLLYFDGSAWQPVLSSGGVAPVKDTTDNLDGTTSGGRFTVVFDATSTPAVTQLTGTVFATTTPPKKNAYKEKPKIVTDPSSVTVKAGGTATFKVTAVSVLAVTYQWYVDGKKNGAIAGATGPTLVLKNVATADSGTYLVVVTNANGSTTSKKAKLTVSGN